MPHRFNIEIEKRSERRLTPEKVNSQIKYILARALSSGRSEKGWSGDYESQPVTQSKSKYLYRYDLMMVFSPARERTEEQVQTELSTLVKIIADAGNSRDWKVSRVNGKVWESKITTTAEGKVVKPYAEVVIPADWRSYFAHIYDRDDQIDIIMSRIEAGNESSWQNRFHAALVGEPAGGKALPSDTARVLTITGWKLIKDMKIGDEIINPANGLTQTITGVFPQGIKPVYRIMFSDRTSVLCCNEHLWFTETRLARKNAQRKDKPLFAKGKVRTTKEIGDTLLYGGHSNHYIPMADCSALDNHGDRPIDPYLLGLLLGDGCFFNFVRFSTADDEIMNAFWSLLPLDCDLVHDAKYDYRIRGTEKMGNSVMSGIHKLGLWEKDSLSKFIPESYMFAPPAVRLAILQGLMDTDGTVHSGCPEFNTSSEKLVEGVSFIVQSLGGTAQLISKVPVYTYRGVKLEGQMAYRLHINLPADLPPFRLERKLKRLNTKRIKFPSRSITAVEFVADMECTCIAVSGAEGLFVTDNCTVTHNTEVARAFKKLLGDDAILELDGTATTMAGAIKNLDDRPTMPRIVIIEEIEKADFKQYPWLLAVLDPRAEIRKLNFKGGVHLDAAMFAIATVNNYGVFKRALEGALASRFGEPIFFPRPSAEIVRKILERDIKALKNGNMAWIKPAIEYAQENEIHDPRAIRSICLAGRDALLDKSYQRKLKASLIPKEYQDRS